MTAPFDDMHTTSTKNERLKQAVQFLYNNLDLRWLKNIQMTYFNPLFISDWIT